MEKNRAFDLSVYFIADPHACAGCDVAGIVKAAAEGGVTLVQLRNKIDGLEIITRQAEELYTILKPRGIPLIINDHVEIAAAFDGVHLGQGDADPDDARRFLGADKIIGITAFEENHFRAMDPASIDYAGTGPFYKTLTKPDKKILGPDGFRKLVKISSVPVVAIGGITPQNAFAAIEAGAAGVATMRGISENPDPAAAAREFSSVVNNTRMRIAS